MFESIAHWYYGLPPYAWWVLNLIFLLMTVFFIGLVTFGMIVNNGELSEDDAPKSLRQFVIAIFTLGFFVSIILATIWFIAFRQR